MKWLICSIISSVLVTLSLSTTSEFKDFILKAHNDLRRDVALGKTPNQPAAANMVEMIWDDELAGKAEEWAGKCVAGHDTYDDRKLEKFPFVGQNMFAGPNYKEVALGWYDEYKDYSFDGKSCSGVCGHYTQFAWAKSYAVGCAAVNCKEKTGSFPYGWLFICNYGPAGNFNDEPVYEAGPACSKCPKGTTCKDSLCALDDPKAGLEFEDEERKKRDNVKRHHGQVHDYDKRHHGQVHDYDKRHHGQIHDYDKRHHGQIHDYDKRHHGQVHDYDKRHHGQVHDYDKRHHGQVHDYDKRHHGQVHDYDKRHHGQVHDYDKRHHGQVHDYDKRHHGQVHDYDKRHHGQVHDYDKRHRG